MKVRKFYLSVLFFLTLGMTSSAVAFDIDTHFYMTALRLIFLGVKPEVAFKVAAAAQQIDESPLTTPMFTERQRRLFHFPQELVAPQLNIPNEELVLEFLKKSGVTHEIAAQIIRDTPQLIGSKDIVHGQELNALAGVIRDNPFAYNLIFYAVKRKSILALGAAWHVLDDSFGHRNYSAAIGHANAAHRPDDPGAYWENYKKAMAASIQVFRLVTRLMPANMMDPTFILPGTNIRAVDASAAQVTDALLNNKDYVGVMSLTALRTPRYTFYVISSVLFGLIQDGIIIDQNEVTKILSNKALFEQKKDAYEILSEIIERYIVLPEAERAKYFDLAKLRQKITKSLTLGRSLDTLINAKKDVFDSEGTSAVKEVAKEITETLLLTEVPMELSKERSFLIEKSNAFRRMELNIRIGNVKNLIFQFSGRKVVFTAESPKKALREIIDSEGEIENAIEAVKDIEIATLSRSEKLRWTWQMFRYYLVDLIFGLRLKNGWGPGWKNIFNWIGATDLAHTKANPQVISLMDPNEFDKAVKTGVFKQFVTVKEGEKMIEHHRTLNAKLKVEAQKYLALKAQKAGVPGIYSCAKSYQ